MTSIFGAPLTAGFAAAMGSAVAADPAGQQLTSSITSRLTKSYASAEAIAQRYPQYASQITAAAKAPFQAGDQWAYLAGIVAILFGAVLVFFLFPEGDAEKQLLAEYHAADTPGPGGRVWASRPPA
jgi:MFS transporter, DHA2 family, multidrug resistance protein